MSEALIGLVSISDRASTGVYTAVTNLRPEMLNYMQMWPAPNGPEIFVPATAPGTGAAVSGGLPRGHASGRDRPSGGAALGNGLE